MPVQAQADIEEQIDTQIGWVPAIKELLLLCETEGLTKGTIKTTKSALDRFKIYCVEQKHCLYPTQVTRSMIRDYIAFYGKMGMFLALSMHTFQK